MQTYTATTTFLTPPRNQGQPVERSYALDQEAGVILERTYDGSDRTTTYRAYAYPDSDDGTWEPQNDVPDLGDDLGACLVADDDGEE